MSEPNALLLNSLKQAIEMLESMDVDVLGEAGTAEDSWPLRDEYLHNWRDAVQRAEAEDALLSSVVTPQQRDEKDL
jgi:hypothetical protein